MRPFLMRPFLMRPSYASYGSAGTVSHHRYADLKESWFFKNHSNVSKSLTLKAWKPI